MAGGRGSRLKMGEKPLVTLFGKALIDYVTMALEDSATERIFVATTDNVPKTRMWATERDLEVVNTPGRGFVADMIYAVETASITKPIMIIMADLPLVTPDLIDEIIEIYVKGLSLPSLHILPSNCTADLAADPIHSSITRASSLFHRV